MKNSELFHNLSSNYNFQESLWMEQNRKRENKCKREREK